MFMRTLAFGCLLLMSAAASFGQDLSGTWVDESSSAENTLTHNGGTITATAWGGADNPELKGSHRLTGGPTVFRGTWENSKPGWSGSGSIVYHVVDKDTILVAYAGTVVNGQNQAPVSDAGRMRRKGAVGSPVAMTGKWLYAVDGVGNSTMTFIPRGEGKYDVVFSGTSEARGTATLVKDQLTVVGTTNDGRYSGTSTFTMGLGGGVGSVTWDKQPADDTRVSPFKAKLTFIPENQ